MKSLGRTLWVLAVLIAPCTDRLAAQASPGLRIGLEVAPTVALPLGDFASDDGLGAGTGVGVEAGATVGLGSILGVYGSYQYLQFGCDQCADARLDDRVVDMGFEAGIELTPGAALLPVRSWVRLGIVGHQLRFSGLGDTSTSEMGFGVGAGAGVVIPLVASLAVTPGVRFRAYSARFDLANLPDPDADVMYGAATIGLSYRF